jgi:hypothetical protein
MSIFYSTPGPTREQKSSDAEHGDRVEVFFCRLEKEGLPDRQGFAATRAFKYSSEKKIFSATV